ncbi:MAG: hypothetical protein A3H69_00455 [Candidatus Sungbacteria bacterium RIFCSPLOWO2_02_FULL_47_9]|uniref:Peptidase S54 rhomboid domain-containing protein n=2 Tax=Parcubacteria group TaxID=1794811 RepID=A0A1G2RPW8_9BACT|nr:MAG: hypothetical protein A2633_00825 [Candidatus Sungbacteria bacterium RIFCSPHIGHO2_01_FULL_47_32]OHA11100.1 MAG: hypothetical protein A3H69_00455 [Candidatus Sungbacteria bacterium RIFCSPLOWO2_02_FULL_47_9]OHA74915.1 MAG: hypothetical protein A3A32_03650 [Candidatus Wildermuthbacteria bacterium RIFCSPLOWO2_01_FULL_48_35]
MKLSYNSPIILTLALVSAVVLAFDSFLFTGLVANFFTTPTAFTPYSPTDYFRFVSYVFGHANWAHLSGNFLLILLVGPSVEERYGSGRLLFMILATTVASAAAMFFFFHYHALGASGIAFMLIILNSFTGKTSDAGKVLVPITFLLVFSLYFGSELMSSLQTDNTSHFGHLAGGAFGALFGFFMRPERGGLRHIGGSTRTLTNK